MSRPAGFLLALVWALVATPLTTSAVNPEPDPPVRVDFARDVKPILAKHCHSCHGPDKQKAGLRLDRKADALQGGDSGKVIVPGKPAASLLLQLVRGQDKDRVMPPKGGPLTAGEIATLQVWIEEGANWPDDGSRTPNAADWWSLKPVTRPEVPQVNAEWKSRVRNPIDAFILAKLSDSGLSPSPEADRRTLIRRVYFDLIGVPPSPGEIDAFAADPAPDAYETLVDRLLASPHHGERWARHWLDVVHFGETHGYDKDKPRPSAWPYRDYVIRSLNADKPYGRFIKEQIAGDVLFPGTVDGIVATGFIAAGPWDFIGHAEVPESKIDGKIARHFDRDDYVANTMSTFTGLTVHCAQCHNHKFDPISQEDYYSLQAVFAAIDRTDKAFDADPVIAAKRADLEASKQRANETIDRIGAIAKKKAGKELAALDARIAAAKPASAERRAEYGYHSAIAQQQDAVKWVQVDLGASVKLDRVVLQPCRDDFNGIGAGFGFPLRFKVEASDDVDFKTGVLILGDHTAADFTNPGIAAVPFSTNGKSSRYVRVTATKLSPRQNDFIFAISEIEAFDASGKNLAAGTNVSALDSIEAPVRWRRSNLTDGIYPSAGKRTSDDRVKLIGEREGLFMKALTPEAVADYQAANATLDAAEAELKKLGPPSHRAYVGAIHTGGGTFSGTGSTGGKPRPIFVLARGDVTRPGKQIGPGAISAIPGLKRRFELPANHVEGERRAALARWLTDANNPLTWRVMANRVWQYHFGRGLVDTPNDFGKMGQLPTHPELLDWLAVELRDNGQSLKHLHRLIATSATYRQVSMSNPREGKADIDNCYLWRQNRRKLEAEAVRDSILSVSGKLDLTMGGPSFQDFVIQKPEHSPHYEYQLHDPEDVKSHRRAVYRFVVRSKQQPFMAAFDCADPSLAVEKRNETITPQQALALLNNRLSLTMAKHFAARLEKLADTDAERLTIAFRLALGRDPRQVELEAIVIYAKEHGLANACRVILNLNEFIFVD